MTGKPLFPALTKRRPCLLAAAALALALAGCSSDSHKVLPDTTALPSRGEIVAEQQRATTAMRDLAARKSDQDKTAQEIDRSR